MYCPISGRMAGSMARVAYVSCNQENRPEEIRLSYRCNSTPSCYFPAQIEQLTWPVNERHKKTTRATGWAGGEWLILRVTGELSPTRSYGTLAIVSSISSVSGFNVALSI
jgi:hypothetical protein